MERSSYVALILLFFCSLAASSSAMYRGVDVDEPFTPSAEPPVDPTKPREYIVTLSRPEGVDPKTFDISILASVLGSKEAAAKAITFTLAGTTGFVANLTPPQAEELKKNPNVFNVFLDTVYQLANSNFDS